MSLKRLLPLLSIAALCWLESSATRAQSQVRRDDPIRFQVATNLILVDVRVLDSTGQPIPGLKLADFKLIEEGQEQTINYFREVSIPLESRSPVVTARPAADVAPPPPAATSPSLDLTDKRLLIMLFNISSASLQDRHMMREAADKFVNEQLTDQDAVAVLVMDTSLEMLTDLTTDRDQIRSSLGRLAGITEESDVSLPDEEEGSDEDSEFLADETEFALFQTNQQLAAIQSVADAFRDLAGRKALLYFSGGLSNRGVETIDQMRVVTDICNRANMSIYSVDSRGLVALSPGGGAQRSGGGGRSIFNGRASLNQLAGLQQSQEGLLALSADTGGQALVDDNDLSKIFRQAQEDSSHYYLLGYETPKAAADGRFRKIEVTVSVNGSKVISRPGFYSDKPYRQLSSAEREFQLLQAVVDNEPQTDFPVVGGAEYFPVDEGYEVAVLAAVEHTRLASGGDDSDLNLEVILVARTSGQAAYDGIRDQVSIRRRQIEGETTYVYQNLLYLEPGNYQLAVYVRNNRTGQMGSSSLSLSLVPPDPNLPSSSLVLAGGWKETATSESYRIKRGKVVTVVENPLEVAGRVLVPRVDSVFRAGEDLYLHLKMPGNETIDYRIQVVTAGATVFESSWKSTRGTTDWQEANARIPLDSLEAGDYQVILEIKLADYTRQVARTFQIAPK